MKTREELEDRIAQLEEIVGLTAYVPIEQQLRKRGLMPLEAKFLGLLMHRAFVPHACGYDALYGGVSESKQPDYLESLRTVIKRLRRVVRQYDVEITTCYGEGYFLEPKQKQKLRDAWPELGRQVGSPTKCPGVNNGNGAPRSIAAKGVSEFKRENSLVG